MQGKAPRSNTETHLDREQQEPGAGNPSAGGGEGPWGCLGAQLQRGRSSPRSSTVPEQAQQAPPSVFSLLGDERHCLAPSVSVLLVQTKRKQLPGQVPDSCFQPRSRRREQDRGTLTLLSCYCTLQGPSSHPFPPLAQPQQQETQGPSARRGKSLLSLLGRCPDPLGSSRQWPCTHPSVGAANNSLNCCHFQNTPKN